MGIFYDNSTPKEAGGMRIAYERQNANKYYLTHYANSLLLSAIVRNTTDIFEKMQATKELAMCDKKMAHWKRHPNYDDKVVMSGIAVLKKTLAGFRPR